MFCWNWYGFSQVGMITHKDQTFDNILLVGAGIRCCKFRTTWSSSRRAPGPFGGRTKANLGSLLCIRLHGVPQEGCVNLKGWDKSANLCHLVLQHGGVEILWRVCICVCVCEPFVMHESSDNAWGYATLWHSMAFTILATAPWSIFGKK
jgi:hypothetical protein